MVHNSKVKGRRQLQGEDGHGEDGGKMGRQQTGLRNLGQIMMKNEIGKSKKSSPDSSLNNNRNRPLVEQHYRNLHSNHDNSVDRQKNSNHYVLVVLESARPDLVMPELRFLNEIRNTDPTPSPGVAADYSGNTYTHHSNTLKSALAFLCNYVSGTKFGYDLLGEFLEVVGEGTEGEAEIEKNSSSSSFHREEDRNACLPHLLQKYRNYKTALLSTGEHKNHILGEDLMRALGFGTIRGREDLLSSSKTGQEELSEEQLEEGEKREDERERLKKQILIELEKQIQKEQDKEAQDSFSLLFLADTHAKYRAEALFDGGEGQGNSLKESQNVKQYLDAVRFANDVLGEIYDRFEGVKFVLIGDHGESFSGERGKGYTLHGSNLYENELKVLIRIKYLF